jgi:hypothetical protein
MTSIAWVAHMPDGQPVYCAVLSDGSIVISYDGIDWEVLQ